MSDLVALTIAVIIGTVMGAGAMVSFFSRPQKPTIIYVTMPQVPESDMGSGQGCSAVFTMLLQLVFLVALIFIVAALLL